MELKGKIINFLGDSITEGAGVSNISGNRYDNRLKIMYELKEVYNYGIGGSRLAHQSVASFFMHRKVRFIEKSPCARQCAFCEQKRSTLPSESLRLAAYYSTK